MTKTVFAAAAIAAFAIGFSGQALAADAGATQTVTVAGVNFTDRADVESFYSKLHRAAAVACDSYSANSRVSAGDRLCADRVVAKAVQTLDRPVLTAMHQDRFGPQDRQLASR